MLPPSPPLLPGSVSFALPPSCISRCANESCSDTAMAPACRTEGTMDGVGCPLPVSTQCPGRASDINSPAWLSVLPPVHYIPKYGICLIVLNLHFIEEKTNAPTLMLLMIFDWIEEKMNESDEDRRWVHIKYRICLIVRNLHWIGGGGDFTLLLFMMFGWIYKTMNGGDLLLRWVHQKYVLCQIVKNLHLILNMLLTFC